MTSKHCSVCKRELPFSAFYKAAKSKSGYGNRCKECEYTYQRSRKVQKAEANARWYAHSGAVVNARNRLKNREAREAYLLQKLADLETTERWRRQQAARALQKTKATPPWVDGAHRSRIQRIYAITHTLQEVTGTVYHVDHIVPLVSDTVCGLHVWWNLQPLPEASNVLKNNSFDPRLWPEQGVVAFPSIDGLSAAQFAVLLEKVEDADE